MRCYSVVRMTTTATIGNAPVARNTDPITSHESAAKVQRTPHAMLLLTQFAKKSMTAEEAGTAAGLLGTGYWKRVSDLANAFLIEERWSGLRLMTRLNKSGRKAIVWKITDAGRDVLKEFKAEQKAAAKAN